MTNEIKIILKELEVQESFEGLTENIKLIRLFLNSIKTNSQWQAFIDAKGGHRYGTYSYQVYSFYYAKPELVSLVNNVKSLHTSMENV